LVCCRGSIRSFGDNTLSLYAIRRRTCDTDYALQSNGNLSIDRPNNNVYHRSTAPDDDEEKEKGLASVMGYVLVFEWVYELAFLSDGALVDLCLRTNHSFFDKILYQYANHHRSCCSSCCVRPSYNPSNYHHQSDNRRRHSNAGGEVSV